MNVEDILTGAQAADKVQLLSLFDAVAGVHAACTAKQAEVERVNEKEAFAALKANPPATVAEALVAFETLLLDVDAHHTTLLKEKAEKLEAMREVLA